MNRTVKNVIAWLIVFAVKIVASRPKPQLVYSRVSYKQDRQYENHEGWNNYLRDTGL